MSEPNNSSKERVDSQTSFARESVVQGGDDSARFEEMGSDMPAELSELLSNAQVKAKPDHEPELIMNSDRFEIGSLGQESLEGFIPLKSGEVEQPDAPPFDSARFLQEQAELAALIEGEKPPGFGAQTKEFFARFARLMLANRGKPIRIICAFLLSLSFSWWVLDQKEQIDSFFAALEKNAVTNLGLSTAGPSLTEAEGGEIGLSSEESGALAALLAKAYGQEQADQDLGTQETVAGLIEKGSQSSSVLLARFAKELGKPVDQRSDAMKMLVYWLEVEGSGQGEGTWRPVQTVSSKSEVARSSVSDQAGDQASVGADVKQSLAKPNQSAPNPAKLTQAQSPQTQKVAKSKEPVKAPATQNAPSPLPEKAKPSAELALKSPAPTASSVSKAAVVESAKSEVAQAPQDLPPSKESSGDESTLEPSAAVANDALANSDQSTWSGLFGGFSALWPWGESTEQASDPVSTPDSDNAMMAGQSKDQKDNSPADQGNQVNQVNPATPAPSLAQAQSPNPVDLSAGDARLVSSVNRQVSETRKTELANTQGLRQACFALQTDDVSQIQVADKLFPQVSKLVVGSSFVSERKEVVASYFVALSKDLSRDQFTRVRLKEHRLDSYMISEEGPNKGRLSLGVFAEKEFARNFAADLKLKGFDVEVLARKNRVLMTYQINVPWESREGVQRALSKRLGPDFTDQPCEVNSDLMARLSS